MKRETNFKRGITANEEFLPILQKWQEVLVEYGKAWGWKDCPWWHRERPNLSIFSGAIWRLGGVVLEEFKALKDSRTSENDSSAGRCDLSFTLRTGRKVVHYDAEAKHVWADLDKDASKAVDRTRDGLERACKDAGRIEEKTNPVGIVFASFAIAKYEDRTKKKLESIRARRSAWIRDFLGRFKEEDVSMGWFVLDPPRHEKCPGMAVIMKRV